MEEAEARSERRKTVLAAILGLVAVVLVWRAIWDIAEKIMSPLTSLAIGIVLIVLIGFLKKNLSKKFSSKSCTLKRQGDVYHQIME